MFNEFSRGLEPLLSFQAAMERAMERDFFGHGTPSRGTFPPISVFKSGDDHVLTAELPGAQKDAIEIEVKGDLLRIFGERKPDFARQEVSLHRHERSFGRFDRTVKLPFAIDAARVRASYENGVLSVTLPPLEADKPKKIAVS